MRRTTFGMLLAVGLLLAVSASSGVDVAQAQGADGDLIPVCVQGFESTPGVEYLTQAQIDEIEATWAAYDNKDIPPPRITGYPDPATGSCATENGVPIDYDPAVYTLVCVGSGPEGDGPLVPRLAISRYLTAESDVVLADPETGACPEQGAADDAAQGDGPGGDPVAELSASAYACPDGYAAPAGDPFPSLAVACVAPEAGADFEVRAREGEAQPVLLTTGDGGFVVGAAPASGTGYDVQVALPAGDAGYIVRCAQADGDDAGLVYTGLGFQIRGAAETGDEIACDVFFISAGSGDGTDGGEGPVVGLPNTGTGSASAPAPSGPRCSCS